MKPEQDKLERVHSDLRLMELAERNPSLGGRDLLRTIIERGAHPEAHEPSRVRDLREALRPRSLDDSDYRTPVEQAQHLNQTSQDLRDLYERGAVLKGDTLVLPAEAHELAEEKAAPFLTTFAYAQQKIAQPEQAKEFYELARAISGQTADARTELTVFRIYYDRLNRDEQGKKLGREDEAGRTQAVERTLTEMRALAQEMSQLETRTSVEVGPLPAGKTEGDERSNSTLNVAARVVDLRDESIRFPAGLSFATKERLLTKTLPELDYRLEHGVPRDELHRAIDRRMARPDAEIEREKLTEIGSFLKAYLDERLRDPETRALHSSAVFRDARTVIINARTPAELSHSAEDFLRTNRRRSEELRQHLADPAQYPPPAQRPLDARERNLLFYGRAPEHHTAEMRELRIHYGLTKAERAVRVTQLRRGEIEPSPPLKELLNELAMRQTTKAINHFQASLLNEQMKQPGRVNLYHLNQQVPPHESTYLYEVTERRKQTLQRQPVSERETERVSVSSAPPASESLREYLAHMGQIERRLLNAEVRNRSDERNERGLSDLTITEARSLLPTQTQREVRVRASRLAWEALVPAEVFASNPPPEAVRLSETIAMIQEQLQERARVARSVSDDVQIRLGEDEQKQAALRRYAEQTRTAVYQGFERLDEQRAALFAQRSERREELATHSPSAASSFRTGGRTEVVEVGQEWHYDSLRDVLAKQPGPNLEDRVSSRQLSDLREMEYDKER